MEKGCVSCKQNNTLTNVCLDEFYYCSNCFHIQKQNFSNTNRSKLEYVNNTFIETILSYVNETDKTGKINILVVNDKNTQLLDKITEILSSKMNKYNITTVSVSSFYNASYFSRHHHYKFQLTDYISQILYDKFGTFDLIVLNDALTYSENPSEILNGCKRLSNQDTRIFSINLYTSILFSVNVFSIDKNVNNIFNINSMKTICKNSDLQLDDIFLDNYWMVSIINGYTNDSDMNMTKTISEKLYEEITYNLYDDDLYYNISQFLYTYIHNLNEILEKYKLLGYKVIVVNNLNETEMFININYTKYIQSDKLQVELKKFQNDNTLIVNIDYTNLKFIRNIIMEQTNTKWLFFDLENMIGYHTELVV